MNNPANRSIQELPQKLESHRKWQEGLGGSRIDLSGADLSGADLKGANLSGADLSGADLRGTLLGKARLTRANLSGANLAGATLGGADLRGVNLSGAFLRHAHLFGSVLIGADLTDADLKYADLRGADLTDAKLPEFQLCPPKGTAFRAWKAVRRDSILELEIPADAERTSTLVSRKCRASKALVVSADWLKNSGWSRSAGEERGLFFSMHDADFLYQVGEVAEPDSYDGDIRVECTSGIHFFMTREEAFAYLG